MAFPSLFKQHRHHQRWYRIRASQLLNSGKMMMTRGPLFAPTLRTRRLTLSELLFTMPTVSRGSSGVSYLNVTLEALLCQISKCRRHLAFASLCTNRALHQPVSPMGRPLSRLRSDRSRRIPTTFARASSSCEEATMLASRVAVLVAAAVGLV